MKLFGEYSRNMKGILDGSFVGNWQIRLYWSLVIGLFVLTISRGMVVFYASVYEIQWLLDLQFDLAFIRSTNSKSIFEFDILALVCLFIFATYLIYFFYQGACLDKYVVPVIYDLNITNNEALVAENVVRFVELQTAKDFYYMIVVWRLFCDLWWPDCSLQGRKIVFKTKLTSLPIASAQMRGRIFVLLVVNEIILLLTTLIFLLAFCITGHFYICYISTQLHYYWIAYCLLDYVWFTFISYYLYKMSILIIVLVSITQFGVASCLMLINHKIRHAVRFAMRGKRHTRFCQTLLVHRLLWTIKAHECIVNYIFNNNRVYRTLLLVFLVTNVPINIYLFILTNFQLIDANQVPLLYFVIFMQVAGSMVTIFPLALTNQFVHASGTAFVFIQANIRQDLVSKLKCQLRFELIHSQKPIGYSAGPLKVVTFKALYEFAFLYTALFFILIQMLRNINER